MNRVLITGSRGFTGRYLVAELEQGGWEVWETGIESVRNAPRYLPLDICDAQRCADVIRQVRPEAVVHLAGLAFVADDPNDIYRVNLLGTRNLLCALADHGSRLQSLILASSANVYGNQSGGMLDEQTVPNPANEYAVSKVAMEYVARIWMSRLPIIVTRPFNYTGVGQSERFLIPKIVSHFRRKAPFIELGNLDVARDFSDVRAVAVAYRRLLESRSSNEIVNVCSGTSISLREILDQAAAITGHRMDIRVNPDFVRSNEVSVLCGNPAKLERLIGSWEQRPFRETLEWMLRP